MEEGYPAARLQHTDSLAGAADIAAVADAVELRNEAITSKVNTTSSHKVTSSQIFDNLQAQINVLTAEVRQLRREMHCQVESAVRQAVGSDLTRYQAIRTTNYSTPANIPALRSRRIHTVPVFYMDEDDTELNSFSNNRFRLPEESPAQERAKKRRGGAEESAPPSKRINIKTPSQYLDAPPRRFLSVARKRSFIPISTRRTRNISGDNDIIFPDVRRKPYPTYYPEAHDPRRLREGAMFKIDEMTDQALVANALVEQLLIEQAVGRGHSKSRRRTANRTAAQSTALMQHPKIVLMKAKLRNNGLGDVTIINTESYGLSPNPVSAFQIWGDNLDAHRQRRTTAIQEEVAAYFVLEESVVTELLGGSRTPGPPYEKIFSSLSQPAIAAKPGETPKDLLLISVGKAVRAATGRSRLNFVELCQHLNYLPTARLVRRREASTSSSLAADDETIITPNLHPQGWLPGHKMYMQDRAAPSTV
ncbi:hypothetical protein F5B21DRAFT_521652 [Xylaria acuta]|nr:hypothetical protein F5B21DRAFT_521652 [Xylaria acuta]